MNFWRRIFTESANVAQIKASWSVTLIVYVIKNDDTYIRTEIEFNDGNTLYLNPLVRHQYQYFFDLDKAKVMKGRTYLMWAVYIIVVVAFARLVIKNNKTKNENSGE